MNKKNWMKFLCLIWTDKLKFSFMSSSCFISTESNEHKIGTLKPGKEALTESGHHKNAALKPVEEALRNELECPVCMEEPRLHLLPCAHRCCMPCVGKYKGCLQHWIFMHVVIVLSQFYLLTVWSPFWIQPRLSRFWFINSDWMISDVSMQTFDIFDITIRYIVFRHKLMLKVSLRFIFGFDIL